MKTSTKSEDDPEACALSRESTKEVPNLEGDWLNFFLLLTLYTVQGFPIGLGIALPIVLQGKGSVTYEEQAILSIVSWPFILKLLWVPIVDALYVKRIGRRKCWLLPLQSLVGIILFYLAQNIDDWLPEERKPNIKMIAIVLFSLHFLCATLDIVVDGWSLTMLKKKNIKYASTCITLGVPFGICIGSVFFILLVSKNFSNNYLGTTTAHGLMTMQSFIYVWVVIILSITLLIGIFKKEKHNFGDDYEQISVIQNYKLLWEILKLPRIKKLAIIVLTMKIGFIPSDNISNLKLIDAGVSEVDVMIITALLYVVKCVVPIFVSKYITGPEPLSFYLIVTPIRLLWGLSLGVLIYYTPNVKYNSAGTSLPLFYYFILGCVILVNEILNFLLFLAVTAFFCQISDPRFGGTYLSLFNTFYFLGWLLPNTFILKMIDVLTFGECSNNVQNSCSTSELKEQCKTNKGICEIHVDGYYITLAVCTVFGFVWYCVFKNTIKDYQFLSRSHWTAKVKRPKTGHVKIPCTVPSA